MLAESVFDEVDQLLGAQHLGRGFRQHPQLEGHEHVLLERADGCILVPKWEYSIHHAKKQAMAGQQ